ncbi:MAG: hypothetical protein ACQEP1_06665 [Nanobdellota archaeon]
MVNTEPKYNSGYSLPETIENTKQKADGYHIVAYGDWKKAIELTRQAIIDSQPDESSKNEEEKALEGILIPHEDEGLMGYRERQMEHNYDDRRRRRNFDGLWEKIGNLRPGEDVSFTFKQPNGSGAVEADFTIKEDVYHANIHAEGERAYDLAEQLKKYFDEAGISCNKQREFSETRYNKI